MAYDGSLKFDTKVNTEGFESGVSSLKTVMERLTAAVETLSNTIMNSFNAAGNAVGSVGSSAEKSAAQVEQIGEAAKQAQSDVESLEQQMAKITVTRHDDQPVVDAPMAPQTAELSGGFDQLGADAQQFVDEYSAGISSAQQHTNEFKAEITSLTAQLKAMEQQGMYFGDEEYDAAYMKLAKVKQALADYKREMLNPSEVPVKFDMNSFEGQKRELKRQIAELEKQGISLGNPQYDSLFVALQKVTQAEAEYKRSLLETDQGQKQAKKSADAMKKSLDRATGSMKGSDKAAIPLTKSILKLSNMFKLMLIRAAMRAVIQGIKEGFQNLAQYSDEVNASLSSLKSSFMYLKNSFATAFAPILSSMIPALNALIDAIATALAWIAQFWAALTGKGTFVRAKKTQEDYREGLKKTGGAAKAAGKDAERSTASFDKLNMLTEQNKGGGGGGGASTTDPSEMFETVAVSSELADLLDAIRDKWGEVVSLFSKGFTLGLGDTESRIGTITNGLQSIRQSIKDIFTDPGVQGAAKNWAETTIHNFGVVAGSVASIGLTIASNLIGGISIYLDEAKDRIQRYLISMFDISAETGTIKANYAAAMANIFSAFGEENGQLLTANLIGMFAEGFMGVTELASKFGRDIADMILTPLINNQDKFKSAFNGLLGVGAQVMGDLKKIVTDSFQKMNQVYDQSIKPMFDAFRDGLTEIYGVALDAFETHILPAIQKVADKFSEFRESHLQPLIDRFIEFGGKVAETVKIIWDNALKPFFTWAIQTFAPLIGKAIEGIGTIFGGLLTTVTEVAGHILTVLEGVLTFIQGVFTGDMDKALEGIKGIFRGVFNGIITIVETAINGIVAGLNNVKFDVPEWVPGIGGKHFGFDMNKINLPRLATGTVVPPRAGEFAAILGDNNRETEIVSPLSTMRQALLEALQMSGGAGGGNIHLTINLDSDVVFDKVIEKARAAVDDTGDNPLLV